MVDVAVLMMFHAAQANQPTRFAHCGEADLDVFLFCYWAEEMAQHGTI